MILPGDECGVPGAFFSQELHVTSSVNADQNAGQNLLPLEVARCKVLTTWTAWKQLLLFCFKNMLMWSWQSGKSQVPVCCSGTEQEFRVLTTKEKTLASPRRIPTLEQQDHSCTLELTVSAHAVSSFAAGLVLNPCLMDHQHTAKANPQGPAKSDAEGL